MMTVQAECAAWFEAMPESLGDSATAEALQELVDLDLGSIAAVRSTFRAPVFLSQSLVPGKSCCVSSS